ncbi:hypothetical protein BWGOE4_28130 [Bacillus mycoides]|uniref:Lipoprotein n=1 Tax=Bacillus cereus TaxID=1396 RepID=A0A2B9DUX2_BACCE|nr:MULTISPECIES: hypothetical protein [Bacillus cereus group]EJV71865.1 hypothetical protein IEM_00475 [Bacillus cereus BAG6O-2]OFD46526.1 hypothetical protein BWGOE3_28560 [Bacillus mycoides]OFD58200.1 hypothetical protein BWGOE4_28130 [Bacillus mycoides]OFD59179.1 hypothetical protein BWGOE6_28230 [Bacillus mycoides]OFD64358.1 hypothetical protein BWGOE7_26630 [Bacillus mycoides]
MKKFLLVFPILVVLLSGCSNNDIYGSWEVIDNKKGECPVYYKFETVVKEEKKEKVVHNLVEMQTTNKKEDLFKGSFVKNSNVYHIDYGNSFTSNQSIRNVDGKLNVYFTSVDKMCTYKKTSD